MCDVKRQRVLADREVMLQQESLTAAMLRVMSNSARAGGSSSSMRAADRIEKVRDQLVDDVTRGGHTPDLVAEGRFALGANDGAYLRQNVMPLQTSDIDIACGFCDDRWSLAANVPTAMQASGRTGVIDAIQEEVERELKSQARELKDALSYVGWLLTIPEILRFTQQILSEKKGARAEEARRLVDAFQGASAAGAVQAQQQLMGIQSMDDLMAKQSTGGQVAEQAVTELQAVLEARMEVLVSIRVLFGMPTKLMQAQMDHVLSTSNGTGTRQVYDAINGLASAARSTKAAFDADKKPVLGRAVEYLRLPIPNEIASASLLASPDHAALVYCLNRGLCGQLPPHRLRHSSDPAKRLLYSKPQVRFPGKPALPTAEAERRALNTPGPDELDDEHCFMPPESLSLPMFDDFVLPPDWEQAVANGTADTQRIEPMFVARWAPVKAEAAVNDRARVFVPDFEKKANLSVANAVVYENLVDFYNVMATKEIRDTQRKAMFLGAAAAAKIAQLNHMADIAYLPTEYQNVAPAYYTNRNVGQLLKAGEYAIFLTRPVAVIGMEQRVLYPCDAGLACYTMRDASDEARGLVGGKTAVDMEIDQDLVFTRAVREAQAAQAAAAPTAGQPAPVTRRVHYRNNMGAYLRKLLAAGDTTRKVPIYVASAPGLDTYSGQNFFDQFDRKVTTRQFFPALNQEMFAQKDRFPEDGHSCSATVRHGVNLCRGVARLVAERGRVIQMKDNAPDEVSPDDVARIRRDAVWNDSMREACIAGDRLYAFVRQLSGTISENVDAVCQIDEGMLVRQQQQLRERRARIADRAAQEHMQLVRNVFSTVIRESGLTLGIANGTATGDIGQLKVVSNTLRKQVAELAQGNGNDGFFANSVRLENLLSNGTGEMTLQELFTRLDEAGRALQMAAAKSTSSETPGTGTSLDFLSAPRNSLMLRYKPDALAAIRSAFDIFQKEMLVQHGRLYRTVSAYELMEGNDEALCNAFASFCAHMLVHSRMYSSSTAMYVAAWPAAANAQQLRVSLQRLVQAACSYLRVTAAPNFLATNGKGRSNYFANAPSGGASGAPGLALLSGHLVPSGVWALNMYGNC